MGMILSQYHPPVVNQSSNQTIGYNETKSQYGTCYAHACAEAIISTQKRIIGRKQTDHSVIVNRIIARYGTSGACVSDVLTQQFEDQKDCRGMGWNSVNLTQALDAIKKQRVVIGLFWLSDSDWNKFTNFYQTNPQGILHRMNDGDQGHAVAIVGYEDGIDQNGNHTIEKYFRVKNSWGQNFADKGYFKVCLNFNFRFIDVFFRIKDLPIEERMGLKDVLKFVQTQISDVSMFYHQNYDFANRMKGSI